MVAVPLRLLEQVMLNALLPSLSKLPEPLIVPELMLKLFTLEFTVMRLGATVPLTVTAVGTPGVSSNNTWSPWLNTVWVLLDKLSQSRVLFTSQVPLLLLVLHSR